MPNWHGSGCSSSTREVYYYGTVLAYYYWVLSVLKLPVTVYTESLVVLLVVCGYSNNPFVQLERYY